MDEGKLEEEEDEREGRQQAWRRGIAKGKGQGSEDVRREEMRERWRGSVEEVERQWERMGNKDKD